MNIKSLSLKNILLDDNKEQYFDLSVPSFDISNIGIKDVHLVTQDEEGRLDKICTKYYGDASNIDIVCLINHMFNPFSVKENDLLVIPYINSTAEEIYKKPEIPGWISGGEQKNNKNKTNEKDENRVNRIKQQKSPRKPNDLPEGKTAKKYINGKVILGTHLNTNNG